MPAVALSNAAPVRSSPKFPTGNPTLISARDVNLFYGASQALKSISLDIPEKLVTAFIGPSGCGKSTFLRCFNRMNDLIDDVRIEGSILVGGSDIYARDVDVIEL